MKHNVNIFGFGLLACHNPDGSLAWRRHFLNNITNEGLTYIARAGLTGGAQIGTWYAGLIDLTSYTTGIAAGDTPASHAGWIEFTGYSGNRPTWVNAEAGQIVASNGPFAFPITSNGTIHGIFIVSSNTKGGTTGTLWAHAVLSGDAVVSVGQNLTGTYSASFAGG